MRLRNHICVVRTKTSAPCMHQMLKVAYRPRKRTAGRGANPGAAPAGPGRLDAAGGRILLS